MTRRVAFIVCLVITGIGSLLVSAYGLYVYSGLNLRLDALPMTIFFLLPLVSFPIFLVSFWRHRATVILQWALALIYLADYSILDWRTCAAHDYCTSVMATVLLTLTAHPVEATFAVAAFNLAAVKLRAKR
jgi:hypothetical protein